MNASKAYLKLKGNKRKREKPPSFLFFFALSIIKKYYYYIYFWDLLKEIVQASNCFCLYAML